MFEVGAGLVVHAELLHDPLRASVGRNRAGHDVLEREAFESKIQGQSSSFGGVSVSPVVGGEAPGHVDVFLERTFEARVRQTHDARELDSAWNLESPKAEAVLSEVVLEARSEGVAFCHGERSRKMCCHARIGVQRGEGGQVGPVAKPGEPRGGFEVPQLV